MIKQSQELMGMPISVQIVDAGAKESDAQAVFEYFEYIDKKFSTYKPDSEISKINRGEILPADFSKDMQTVFKLSEETKKETEGYFNIKKSGGSYDPSGLVKGWAINNAADILKKRRFKNFFVEAGGDVQVSGVNSEGNPWRVGIKNPFEQSQIVKAVNLTDTGIATSGNYIRGSHIYNPHRPEAEISEIVSLSVIGPNVYEADRFATAAFAMGREGINFIEKLEGFAGYQIDSKGMATQTSNFDKYVLAHA